jgi:transposase
MRRHELGDNKVRGALPMVHPNAAAIDVGARMHVAAVGADRTAEPVRSFGTFTTDLHRLVDWFAECGVETVVLESTSVYWIPIFELLEARGFVVFLVNARDAKHVPGRKTDVSDAQWLQRLHSHGLLRASFRPKGEIVELRAYLRQRERLLEYAASHIQHMQKALTEMNLQLHHVVADITGATGLRIIRAILAGVIPPRWHGCATSAATPASRRSRRRSRAITVPSTYSRWSKRSLFMMGTRRRHRPVTPGLRWS